MSEENISNKSPDITSEACAWIAQLETGTMSPKDLAALKEWMGRSPRHLQEIRKLARLSEDTFLLSDMAGSISAAASESRATFSSNAGLGNWSLRPVLTACAAAIFVIGFGVFAAPRLLSPPPETFLIATQVGGLEERTLSDGSVVKLNTDSQVEIDFDRKQRRVRLLEGEVFFEVAHNSKRPFVVHAGDKLVEAVGTAFTVRWTEGDLSVTVSEGQVSFAPTIIEIPPVAIVTNANGEISETTKEVSTDAPLLLSAGQKLLIDEDAKEPQLVAQVSPRELRSELSWQDGILDFPEKPLVEVISEINRYTNVRIEITDSELSQLKFGGVFRTGETQPLLDALEQAFNVRVERVSDTYVRIHPAAG